MSSSSFVVVMTFIMICATVIVAVIGGDQDQS